MIGEKRNGAGEFPRIQLKGILAYASQDGILILSQLIDLVDEIHQKELFG